MKYNKIVSRTVFSQRFVASIFVGFLMLGRLAAQTEDAAPATEAAPAKEAAPATEAEKPGVIISEDREELELPGIKIQIKERYVDVDSTVCLTEGLLELIACAKDTKEHESIIVINAKAAHVHASLLLIGARPGTPAQRKMIEIEGSEDVRWIDIPPSGQKVDVFLVVKDEEGKLVEHPISDFLIKDNDGYDASPDEKDKEVERFPTHTFLFAGSHVYKGEKGPARYLADDDGNVISISTFGNELLCLPDIHSHGNEGLVWGVDSTNLPAVDSKVILRLRPQFADAPPAEKKDPENK